MILITNFNRLKTTLLMHPVSLAASALSCGEHSSEGPPEEIQEACGQLESNPPPKHPLCEVLISELGIHGYPAFFLGHEEFTLSPQELDPGLLSDGVRGLGGEVYGGWGLPLGSKVPDDLAALLCASCFMVFSTLSGPMLSGFRIRPPLTLAGDAR
jgi:hypothetical protein